MEESTLFFEMQLRNAAVYQKTKYTQFLKLHFLQTKRNIKKYNGVSKKIKYTQVQDYISFKLIEEKSYSVMNCKIEQQNRTAIKDIQYPNIKKYIQYDLKSINIILNYFDIQTSNRKLLNKIYWRNFIQNF